MEQTFAMTHSLSSHQLSDSSTFPTLISQDIFPKLFFCFALRFFLIYHCLGIAL